MNRAGEKPGFTILTVLLVIGGILFATRGESADVLTKVNSPAALGADDSIAWSQLGADGAVLSSTINANSAGSGAAGAVAVTGALAGSGSLASMVCPASPCSWRSDDPAGFAAGDMVIWTADTANGGNGPLTLTFNKTVKGVGAMIQADGPGQFTAQLEAFNGGASLGSVTATSDANGDATFLGVLDNAAAKITSVVYSLTSCTGACSDFAIDTVFLNTLTPTSMLAVPAQIDFGNVDASGSSKTHAASIANKGAVSASVGGVSVPSGFSVVSGTDLCSGQVVPPKKKCTMMLQFLPATPMPASGTVSVTYNGVAATIALSGNGAAVALKAPSVVKFAPVAAGSTGNPKAVTITNPSKTATVQMNAVSFSGPPFSIKSDTCSGASILPKKKCVIALELSPPADAPSKSPLSGTLDIGFTYGSNPGSVPTIALNGQVK